MGGFSSGFSILPKDVLKSMPIFHQWSNSTIHVENHQGIIEYSDKLVRIDTKCGIMYICGKDMLIKEIDSCSILIFGKIDSIGYKE